MSAFLPRDGGLQSYPLRRLSDGSAEESVEQAPETAKRFRSDPGVQEGGLGCRLWRWEHFPERASPVEVGTGVPPGLRCGCGCVTGWSGLLPHLSHNFLSPLCWVHLLNSHHHYHQVGKTCCSYHSTVLPLGVARMLSRWGGKGGVTGSKHLNFLMPCLLGVTSFRSYLEFSVCGKC